MIVFKQCKVDSSMGSVPSQGVSFEKNDNNGHAMRVPTHDVRKEREATV